MVRHTDVEMTEMKEEVDAHRFPGNRHSLPRKATGEAPGQARSRGSRRRHGQGPLSRFLWKRAEEAWSAGLGSAGLTI